MIKIANFLLTRKCNLSCDYCRISGNINYKGKPGSYPDTKYYSQNEQPVDFWIDVLNRLKNHNPDIFVIFYGGEPFLYKDLDKLVNHANDIDIAYTIISSCNMHIQNVIDGFFDKVNNVKGFTASVDPGFYLDSGVNFNDDAIHKSHTGFSTLKKLISRGLVKDPVAEITAGPDNIQHLYETVKILTSYGITSDITVMDIAKNDYYDFAEPTSSNDLVHQTDEVRKIFDQIIQSSFKVHMKETLLNEIYESLPARIDCKLEKNVHNITIDSDGRFRNCLRIRGLYTPEFSRDYTHVLRNDGSLNTYLRKAIRKDKESLCEGCSWTCVKISQMDSDRIINH